ncbi:MAG TPA: hypothetical protein VGJ60_20260 [Chloroflexota bacterium]|jgi:hypothetical protein
MTKRDYERIASVLVRFSNLQAQVEVGAATAAIADSLANVFAIDNPRFNRDRFLAACDIPARYFENPKQEAA